MPLSWALGSRELRTIHVAFVESTAIESAANDATVIERTRVIAMQLENRTAFVAGMTLGRDKHAREHVIVAIKGTFRIPCHPGDTAAAAENSIPLNVIDTFVGEPGLSAPREEADFALVKPFCDILLNGKAYAPSQAPVERMRVGIKLGGWQKQVDVVGDRVWQMRAGVIAASKPKPFLSVNLSYENGFGGVSRSAHDSEVEVSYEANPVGRGFCDCKNQDAADGLPLPNLESRDDPTSAPWNHHKPAGFGVVGRSWLPRRLYAGTYDQSWLDNEFPFLPRDFDEHYYQAAPGDQQVAYPRGGEEVVLAGVTPDGRRHFRLPDLSMPVVFMRKREPDAHVQAVVDTLTIEPDEERLTLVWRASMRLSRGAQDMAEIIVGRCTNGELRARRTGKRYLRSLEEVRGAPGHG